MNQQKFARNCPICATEKTYATQVKLNCALKNNNPCKSCVMKERHRQNPDRCKGPNNPMFGTSANKIWEATMTREQILEKKSKRSLLHKQK